MITPSARAITVLFFLSVCVCMLCALLLSAYFLFFYIQFLVYRQRAVEREGETKNNKHLSSCRSRGYWLFLLFVGNSFPLLFSSRKKSTCILRGRAREWCARGARWIKKSPCCDYRHINSHQGALPLRNSRLPAMFAVHKRPTAAAPLRSSRKPHKLHAAC